MGPQGRGGGDVGGSEPPIGVMRARKGAWVINAPVVDCLLGWSNRRGGGLPARDGKGLPGGYPLAGGLGQRQFSGGRVIGVSVSAVVCSISSRSIVRTLVR